MKSCYLILGSKEKEQFTQSEIKNRFGVGGEV